MYFIVQVCCYDCRRFESLKVCYHSNYFLFIKNNFNEYQFYTYFIYKVDNECIDVIDGCYINRKLKKFKKKS